MDARLYHRLQRTFLRLPILVSWITLIPLLMESGRLEAAATVVTVQREFDPEGREEDTRGAWLKLVLTEGSEATVRVRTTGDGSATPGEDFVPLDQTYPIERATQGNGFRIPLELLPDAIPEGAQFVSFEITAISADTVITDSEQPTGGALGTRTVRLPLADDDLEPSNALRFGTEPDLRLAVGGRAVSPVITDLNQDGRADVVVALEADNAVALLLGTGNGSTNEWFTPAPGSPFHSGNLPFFLAVADVDGDDLLDVLAANQMDHSLTYLKGDGKGGLVATGAPIPTGQLPRTIRIGDFNGDTFPDLLVSNFGDGTVSLLLGDGMGRFEPSLSSPIEAGTNPWGLATGDFDRNGSLDFAVALTGSNAIRVFRNDGRGRFTGEPLTVGVRPFDVSAADLDLDGNLDLLSANTSFHQLAVFPGLGTGEFNIPRRRKVGGSFPRMVIPVDLTRDGYPELVTANENSSVSLLTGSFGNQPMAGSPLPQPGPVNSVAAGDLNGDGVPDLVVSGPDFGLTFWLNQTGFQVIEAAGATVREHPGVVRIGLFRRWQTGSTLVLQVSTRDGSALAERDYHAVRSEVVFGPGEFAKVVEIPVVDDRYYRGWRTFFLDVATADPTARVPAPVSISIEDDEQPVGLDFRSEPSGLDFSQLRVSENAGRLRIIVGRSAPNTVVDPFEVRYRVEASDGIASPAAVPGVDFQPVNGSLRFESGTLEQSFELRILDNTEADGSRYFRLVLTGRPEAPDQVWFEGQIEIVDNEFALLRQEIAIAPFDQKRATEDPGMRQIVPLSSGKALVWRGSSMLRLNSDGLPDPEVGEGTGRVSMPFDISDFAVFRLIALPNQSFYLVGRPADSTASLVLLRFGPDGRLDPTFGNGTGMRTLPQVEVFDGLSREVFLCPDTGLILRFLEEGRIRIRRLAPDGQWDPGFPTWNDADAVAVAPNGSMFVRQLTGEAVRLLQDGSRDPHFSAPGGLSFNPSPFDSGEQRAQEPRPSFDAEGRFYVGSPNGGLIRILQDGSADPTYRPQLESVPIRWEVFQSGEVFVQMTETVLRIAPDGAVRSQYPLGESFGESYGALRLTKSVGLPSGDIYLSVSRCAQIVPWESCWPMHDVLLHPNGMSTQLPPIAPGFGRTVGPTAVWTAHDENYPVQNPARWWIPQQPSEAGINSTGVFCHQNSARVTIQRTGSTAAAATVRGRIWRRISTRLIEGSVQSWEARFLPGNSETSVELGEWIPDGNWTAGEYLVRLEDSEGVQLSGFTACRIWVLPESAPPQRRELGIATTLDAGFDGDALLVAPKDMEWWSIQEGPSLGGPWKPASLSFVGGVDDSPVLLALPSTNSVRFFKQ